ncbi:LOB domain-containing protein 40-like [Trifolium pratense]|uniref:LOB domain-containing protein 40-like n=1 Tax=Trifolium pratense TaxID=57577 RepID=UPI001E6929B0|nr:LOB domain-containing protein 40-like [Trifolium pratense]
MKLSCNGCRVLRKGCSEDCIIKPCLEWISSAQAQGHATLFLAKFYGRTGLLNLLANAPNQNAEAVFKSLLYEAAGRLVNPTYGALGLFWTGQWSRCEAAVESVLTRSNINDVIAVDGQTSSGTLIAENHVLPTNSDIRHVARGTNVDIKEKTQFKRAGSIFKPKPRIGLANNATLLKSILENDTVTTVETSSMIENEMNETAATQVNLELTLGFNCQSSNGKKII